MRNLQVLLALIFAIVLTAGCSSNPANPFANSDVQPERILLWHTWNSDQDIALDAMLTAYENLNPNVVITSVAVAEEQLITRVENRGQAGLGPDLILTDAGQIYTLAENGLIRDLAPLNLDVSAYLFNALNMVSDDARLYGLPMAAHTQVLYYNRNLVAEPPTTIAELMQRIEAGEPLAQSPHFTESYWGVGAFDGELADSERRLLFGMGGFANWLDFLESARKQPGFLLNEDLATLQQAFIDGEVTYYVGDSEQYLSLTAALGADAVGMAILPTGPNGGAPRPFLNVDALAFSPDSSTREFRAALALAEFLTGVQNQRTFLTGELGLAPVNNQVRLTPNLPEDSLAVMRQSRAAEAIAFVNQPLWRDLRQGALGFFDAYRQVIRGVLPANVMIADSLQRFEETYGLRPKVVAPEDLCPVQPAAIVLWHSLRFDEARAVEELARQFEATCPGTTLALTYVAQEAISDRYREAYRSPADDNADPDLLLLSSRWLATLAEEELLLDLTERVPASYLQQFLPKTVETMRYGGRLYGIPESLEVLALFYNAARVNDPPIDVQQLVRSVNTDARLAMPVSFFSGYWGMDPFGGFEFDSYSGRVGETGGLVNWLTTLQEIDAEAGTDLYFNAADAEDAFAFEEAAYLVSGPWSLPRLRQELGEDRFRVTPLPNGPLMTSSPMLQVVGTVVSANADDLAIDAGLAFSRFLNLTTSQEYMAETGNHISASVTVDLTDYPNIEGFREQAKSAALVVENSNFARLEALGDQLYADVLLNDANPADAVTAFVEAVHQKNGVE